MKGGFVIEPLGAHDRSAFSCGAATLDRYLREQASQDVKRLVASCFVAVETASNAIAGYDTLAATGVPANDLPTRGLKRLSRYPILPAALVGRLAVDQRFHGKGLGSAMLADGALRARKSETTAFALIVDAKDENAITFYRRQQGFTPFASRPMSLLLPLGTAKKGPRAGNHNGLAPLPIPSSFEEGLRAALLRLKAGDAGGYDRGTFVAFPNANGERPPNANACQLEGHTGSL